MKKLIIKTALITVASIVGAVLLTFFTFLAFFPAKLAGFYDKLGFERQAVKQMEREYNKTGDTTDLIKLCQYCDKYGNNQLIAQHFGKLVTDEGFIQYVQGIEKGSEFYDYCAGEYVVALYKMGKDGSFVVDTAFSVLRGYAEYNPVHALIVSAIEREEIDVETLTLIKDNLFVLGQSANGVEAELVNEHYNLLTEILG